MNGFAGGIAARTLVALLISSTLGCGSNGATTGSGGATTTAGTATSSAAGSGGATSTGAGGTGGNATGAGGSSATSAVSTGTGVRVGATSTGSTGTGVSGGATSTGGGTGAACTDPKTQCPPAASECEIAICTNGLCDKASVAVDTSISEQTPGDCKTAVCNGVGGVGSVNNDADVENDNNDCTADSCNVGVPVHAPTVSGTACTDALNPSAKRCDGAGTCVGCLSMADCAAPNFCNVDHQCLPPSCMDALKDGAETDVDCGGPVCGKCADGKLCVTSVDCSSNACSGGVCQTAILQACTDVATARCNRYQACTNGIHILDHYGTMATCVARHVLSCQQSLLSPGTGATVTTVKACAAALPGESCADLLDGNPVPACMSQVGMRVNGAACVYGSQCQSAFCRTTAGQACGVCATTPPDGTPCGSSSECGNNQTCSKITATCVTYVPLSGACASGTPCQAGLSCVGLTAATSTCVPKANTVGQLCDPKHLTAPSCDHDLGVYCNKVTATCQAITYSANGQPCGTVNGAFDACTGGGMCVISVGFSGICAAPAADGAACSSVGGPPCLFPARCVNGACTVPDGAACP